MERARYDGHNRKSGHAKALRQIVTRRWRRRMVRLLRQLRGNRQEAA